MGLQIKYNHENDLIMLLLYINTFLVVIIFRLTEDFQKSLSSRLGVSAAFLFLIAHV